MINNIILFADSEVGEYAVDLFMRTHPGNIRAIVVNNDKFYENFRTKYEFEHLFIFEDEARLRNKLNLLVDAYTVSLLAWWPHIMSSELIEFLQGKIINTHPSYLPYGRGKNPSFWSVINNEPYGVSLHLVDEKIDHGPIIARTEIKYDVTKTGRQLYDLAVDEMKMLIERYSSQILEWSFNTIEVNITNEKVRKAVEIGEASRIHVDKEYCALELITLLVAGNYGNYYPSCWFELDGRRYEVRAEVRAVEPK